jgi:hypothetical protein
MQGEVSGEIPKLKIPLNRKEREIFSFLKEGNPVKGKPSKLYRYYYFGS